MPTDTIELTQPSLREAPEVLNAIHVRSFSVAVLLLLVVDAVVLVAVEDESLVALPGIGVDRRSLFYDSRNDGQKLFAARILDDLSVDTAIALENAEDGNFVRASAALGILRLPEVALIQFHFAAERSIDRFLILKDRLSEELVVPVDSDAADVGQVRCLCGR